MPDLHIFCTLSAADAIAARSAIAGDLDIPLSESHIDELHLADLSDTAENYTGTHDRMTRESEASRLVIKGPTWRHVIEALTRIHDGRTISTRAAHALLTAVAPQHLERYLAGMMPPDEILAIAREKAFMTFVDLPRLVTARDFVTAKSVNHKGACQSGAEAVVFSANEYSGLTAPEFVVYRKYGAAATRARPAWEALGLSDYFTADPLLTVKCHRGKCGDCQAFTSRLAVHVEIPWAGRFLHRAYVL